MTSLSSFIEKLEDKLGTGRMVSEILMEWEFGCPQCGVATKLHISLSKGCFRCVRCEYSGNLKRLKEDLGITDDFTVSQGMTRREPTEEMKRTMKSVCDFILRNGKLTKSHEEWLVRRGIKVRGDDAILVRSSNGLLGKLKDEFEWSDLEKAGFIRDDGEPRLIMRENNILIPYWDPRIKAWSYVRARTLGSNSIAKYVAPAGYPAFDKVWGWERVPAGSDLIITEGEFKAQAARQLGFPAVALPGINSGHASALDTAKLFRIRTCFIMFDYEADVDKCSMVNEMAHRIRREGAMRGVNVRVAHLPSLSEMKMDIDTFALRRGARAAKELESILKRAN